MKAKPQQQIFLEGLLEGIQAGNKQQNQPFTMSMGKGKKIEIYPNCKGFFVYRVLPDGLWTDCTSKEDIQTIFN